MLIIDLGEVEVSVDIAATETQIQNALSGIIGDRQCLCVLIEDPEYSADLLCTREGIATEQAAFNSRLRATVWSCKRCRLNENQSQILYLRIGDDASGSAERLDRLTLQLRRAIGELPVDAVELVKKPANDPGQKSIDAVAVGELVVKLLPDVVPVLCALLKKWIGRSSSRQLTITIGGVKIEISGNLTSEQQAALIEAIAKSNTVGN